MRRQTLMIGLGAKPVIPVVSTNSGKLPANSSQFLSPPAQAATMTVPDKLE
jgi:hypothetical protein